MRQRFSFATYALIRIRDKPAKPIEVSRSPVLLNCSIFSVPTISSNKRSISAGRRLFSRMRISEFTRIAMGEPSSRWISEEPALIAKPTISRAIDMGWQQEGRVNARYCKSSAIQRL